MKIEIEKNVISKLIYKKKNIINPWGIETADSWSFFSMEEGVGYRYSIKEENYTFEEGKYKYDLTIKMREGLWELRGEEYETDNAVYRNVELNCIEESNFLDYVLRYRIKKDIICYAIINDKYIVHKNSNTYYQEEVDEIVLVGHDFVLRIACLGCNVPDGMKRVMYVRDHLDEWVVHIRFLPIRCDKKVIKLCNSWFKTKPIKSRISEVILKNRTLEDYLMYHNERSPYKSVIMKLINPNAYRLIKLKKGERMKIVSRLSVEEKRKDDFISIIVPTYKRCDFLERLLQEIGRQSYQNYEVIVVDDCSPNLDEYAATISRCDKFIADLSYYRNDRNMGAPYSRNFGIKKAKYDLIALVDDDDEWYEDKLEKQVIVLRAASEETGLVYSWADIKQEGKKIGEYTDSYEGNVMPFIIRGNFIPSPSVLIKKEALIKAGMFDEHLPSCQDWDMWFKIFEAGYEAKVAKEKLVTYNKHKRGSIGLSPKAKLGYKMFYRRHYKTIMRYYIAENNIFACLKLFKHMFVG